MIYLETFLLLLILHGIGDFILQPEFVAKGKNPNTPVLPGITVWPYALLAHSGFHAGMVWWLLGPWFGLAEFVIHTVIDFMKPRWKMSRACAFHYDQLLHILSKIGYVYGLKIAAIYNQLS